MKKTLYILVTTLFLSSCAILPDVSYEQSNASLIQKSIKNLNTLEKLKSQINKSDKIAIVGMEDYNTKDWSLSATLEDEIIKEFVEGGYKMLERDNDMVYRLFSEESKNYKHINRRKAVNFGASVYDQNKKYSSYYLNGNANTNAASVFSEVKNYDQALQSSLQSADKIISYRVIESGIHYFNDNKEAKIGEVERGARTILEVRLTDAKTSEILSALTLDGKANDFIQERDMYALKDFGYRFYKHTLPKIYGPPKESTATGARRSAWPWIAGSVGFLFVISLISGG